MTEILKRTIPEKIFLVLVCAIALCIPFHKTLASPIILLSFILIVFSGDYINKWQRLKENKHNYIFIAFYLLFIFGYLMSDDKSNAILDLKVKLYLLLIPIFWTAAIVFTKLEVRRIFVCFVISCVLFALFALVRAAYFYITLGENNFYYLDLVAFTYMHPAYIGMFEAFACILLAIDMIQNFADFSKLKRLLYLGGILFLTLFIFLLTAKMAIASLFIFLNIAFFIWGKSNLGKGRALIILILANAFAVFILMSLPYTRERIKLLFTYNEVTYANSVDSRSEIWKAAITLSKEHPIFGIGSGDSEEALVKQYATNGFQKGVDERYNTHNQYLQVLIETGWFGLLLFLGFLGYCIRLAIMHKNYLYLAFLLLFIINIATESMLKTQSGVVFFVFFNTLCSAGFSRKSAY